MLFHLVLDGVADSALGVAVDIAGLAARFAETGPAPIARGSRGLAQRVVSLDGEPVRSSAGRVVAVDRAVTSRDLRRGDVVLVPGMFSSSSHTVDQLLAREDVRRAGELCVAALAKGVVVAASCSATFVLAAAGLLDGRSATTSWWLVPELAQRFPRVSLVADRMVVDEGHILTAGAALAHADLALALTTRLAGPSIAHLVARYLVLDERPSQARYMVIDHLRVSDPAIVAMERFIGKHLDRQIELAELARAAKVSPRTLARKVQASLGMTPQELVQRMRVDRAKHLLETTSASVDHIAAKVGYADPSAFRRVFRRYAGESPRSSRRAASAG